jgi:hypothetical protein
LTDGTRAGFAGRIRKLQKKMKGAPPTAKRPSSGTARTRGKRKS